MPIEVRVPEVGESIREVQIAVWFKQEGEWVDKNENLVEIETEKATVQIAAPAAGTVAKLLRRQGETVAVGEVIAQLDPGPRGAGAPAAASATTADGAGPNHGGAAAHDEVLPTPAAGARSFPVPGGQPPTPPASAPMRTPNQPRTAPPTVMPAAQRALAERGLRAEQVEATGPGGRLLKEDVLTQPRLAPVPGPAVPMRAEPLPGTREEETVPMSMIRRRIAERLVEAQQQAALLTTFNEADMSAVMELRTRHREVFQQRHGVKLGFMSFFVKAAVEALRRFPAVNAEVRGDQIVYRRYYDVGIAVGGGKGLVVPVLRNAEAMSFAQIEQAIEQFAARAKENKITPDELQGGTFTISNGGVYGSLLSTPIVNPPQSGILGLHAIQERPVARAGQVVIRPMMYLALTYDHRIVDGREAVGFLRTIKELVEDPARLLLEV